MSPKGTVSLPRHDPPGLPSASSLPLFSFSTMCGHASYTLLTHHTDILHTCLLVSRTGALCHPGRPGPPPHQPSLVNSYLSFMTQMQSHLFWEALPDSLAARWSVLPLSCQGPHQLTPMVPVTSTTTCTFTPDKAGSSLGTGTSSLALHLSHLSWCLFRWKPSVTVGRRRE